MIGVACPNASSDQSEKEGMTLFLVGLLGIVLALLPGCDPIVEPTVDTVPEGLWQGETNTNRTLTAAVFEDGTYFFFYSAVANPAVIGGVIQGSGTSEDGTFTSDNARDFVVGGNVLNATVSAGYGIRQFLNGSIAYPGGGIQSFTSSYNIVFDDPTPILATMAGVYQVQAGRIGGVQSGTVTVLADGTFEGSEQDGCTFTGRVTPRSHGNVFDYQITFGGPPCFLSGTTLQGMWYVDLLTRRLFAAAPTATRADAAILFGTKIL